MHLLFRTCRYQWPCHVGLDCHGRRIGRGRGRPRRFRTPRQTAPPCRAPRLTAPFFDCMNIRNYSEGYQKRKEYLKPYTSPDDSRLQVIYIVPQFTCADLLRKPNCILLYLVYTYPPPFTQWLEGEFLSYLDDWESTVKSSNHTASEKRKMCLSDETLQGIRMTGMYSYLPS